MCVGFRCWGDKFAYVILDGDQDNPTVIDHGLRSCPPRPSRAEQLHWLRNEVHEILNKASIESGYYKGIENNSRKVDKSRCEFEGIIQEAGYSHRLRISIQKLVKSQINSHTNARGQKYLGELLKTDTLKKLDKDHFLEACLASLCGLPIKDA